MSPKSSLTKEGQRRQVQQFIVTAQSRDHLNWDIIVNTARMILPIF